MQCFCLLATVALGTFAITTLLLSLASELTASPSFLYSGVRLLQCPHLQAQQGSGICRVPDNDTVGFLPNSVLIGAAELTKVHRTPR